MKKTLMLCTLVVALTSCTDAEVASFSAYGDEANIKCYSGGQVVFEATSTGKVEQLDGDGITFMAKGSGDYVRAYADCIVIAK